MPDNDIQSDPPDPSPNPVSDEAAIARDRGGRVKRLPGCPAWMPPAVFVMVLAVVIYLLNTGYTTESALLVILAVAAATGDVLRRLGHSGLASTA